LHRRNFSPKSAFLITFSEENCREFAAFCIENFSKKLRHDSQFILTMGKRRTRTAVRRGSGSKFVWVNKDSEAQETNPPAIEKRNPVVWTDAGLAKLVVVTREICEETSAQMTEVGGPKSCGSALCRLLSVFACFGAKKGESTSVKPL
jgi:hypothetical protein